MILIDMYKLLQVEFHYLLCIFNHSNPWLVYLNRVFILHLSWDLLFLFDIDITTILWNIIIKMLLVNLHQEPCSSISCHFLVFPTETSRVQISPPSCKY